MLIAKYTANKRGVVPIFDEGYQYTVNETVSNGIYTVEINSDTDFTICSFSGKTNLLTVEYLKVTSQATDMHDMFNSCSQLTQLDVGNWDTSNVETMIYMFQNCSQLTQLDVSKWNTGNVTNMSYMFENCSQLTQLDVSKWDTSKVTSMSSMFNSCSQLTQLDVGNWDISNVETMSNMFRSCSQLTQLDVSNFDTSKVTSMGYMFRNCNNLINIGMIYCSLGTINKLSSLLPTTKAKQVYVQDVNSSECTAVSNVTFIDYKACNQIIQIPIQLVGGAELYWDEELKVYCIKDFSNNIIQTDITNPITLNTYNPYYKISIDGNEPINIKANIAMKKNKTKEQKK